ncbi:MAG: multidrug ABC transporter ATP-binding protein [Candidatus Rokuibacteriota bacterium]|nr:MAG: multidrug ABC transporter ATP-binding protein [Candidatus Rokubacteria bacterium]
MLAAASFELAPPFIIRAIVDDHLIVGRSAGLLLLAILYLGANAAVQAMTFLYSYLAATIAQGVLSSLRVRLFAHIQRLPISHIDRTPVGDVISRCTSDIEALDTVFSSGVAVLVANLVRLLTLTIGMIVLSPPLTLVAGLVAPPLVITLRFLQVRVRQSERATRIAIGALTARLQESLRGIEVIRAFGRESEAVGGFRQVLSGALTASNRATRFSALYTPVTAILASLAVASLLWAGTRPTFDAFGISLGTLAAFLILLQRVFQPITALGEEWQTVQGALAGAERIFATLALAAEDTVPITMRPAKTAERPPIHLSDVVFGYAEGQRVLHRISLVVNASEHVALVGRTGAGKTSALQLLAGLYAPWTGTVCVTGRDPALLEESERRKLLGVVPQVVQLFSGTVFENLTLGDASVPEEAVFEAARIAGADAFVRALPMGYQTLLSSSSGGEGTQLSAGQQQLLALARALVHKPAVLLLDEATAAIDGVSDAAFRAALRRSVLPAGCAVLTVAHRLSTAVEADRVIVLEKGSIVEEGAPSELAGRAGRFAALLELEAAGWDWRSGP